MACAALACGGGGDDSDGDGGLDAGNGAEAAACPNDLPASCPSEAPGYAATIRPIIDAHCVPCHAAAGTESSKPFETYQQVYTRRRMILTQVYSCKMPPSDGTPLNADERAALLAWLVCGAKQD